ncbi:MAG: endolytic transglycosylase MltG, partial [Thermomicrobiales bacterium]|nr:endolytic transglycosylase MltG [Thermomicrobiales bacterium]
GSVANLIDYQLQNFQDHLTDDILAGFEAQDLSVFQAVTVASIVEREAAVSIERPSIAEVYLNRFHDDMNLNADPSQQYGIGTAENDWWPRLTEDDNLAKSKETAYDTYMA